MAKTKITAYFKESYDELMHKVSWPSWSELQGSAIVVSVCFPDHRPRRFF